MEANSSKEHSNLLYIGIDDLLGYLRAHKTVSGIQRAQVGFIQYLLAGQRVNSAKSRSCEVVTMAVVFGGCSQLRLPNLSIMSRATWSFTND